MKEFKFQSGRQKWNGMKYLTLKTFKGNATDHWKLENGIQHNHNKEQKCVRTQLNLNTKMFVIYSA